jgi:hypothetical protein
LIKKVVLAVSAVAAIAAAAGVVIVAAAYALFALVSPELGAAGGSAVVALAAALLVGFIGLIAWMKLRPPRRFASAKGPPAGDFMARAVNLARERPIMAAGALVAASVIAMRNPALTALVVKSFLDSKKPPKS